MFLSCVGFNHQFTPLHVREKVSLCDEVCAGLSRKIIASEVASEAIILSTCNRTEIYTIGSCLEGLSETVYMLLSKTVSLEPEVLKKVSYSYGEEDALRHIFRVASSLDSMVVGEAEILGQVKAAYQSAVESETVGAYLHKALHSAFRVAKRVRTETAIAELSVSVGSLAVELAEKELGKISGAAVLVIGAGEASSLVANHLRKKGAGHLWITNRTPASAEMLASEVGGVAVPFGSWPAHMQTADVVITSIGGGTLISGEQVREACSIRAGRKLLMIDLAVPRNIGSTVCSDSVRVFNIDDIQKIAEHNILARKNAALKAETIVASEASSCFSELKAIKMGPILESLYKKCSFVIESETYRLFKDNPGLTTDERLAIKRCAEAIVRKIVSEPIKLAKEEMIRSEQGEGPAERILNRLLS